MKFIDEELELNNEFWQFSLACYEQPDIAEICLEWQERFGLDVNLLLFCAYLHAKGVAFSESEFQSLLLVLAPIQTQIQLQRQKRKSLKTIDDAEYRLALKQELALEQQQQALIYPYSLKVKHSQNSELIDLWLAYIAAVAPANSPNSSALKRASLNFHNVIKTLAI